MATTATKSTTQLDAPAPDPGTRSIESGIVAFLKADAGLSALTHGRIWPKKGPIGTAYPQITFGLSLHDPVTTHDGVAKLRKATVEIHCWGREPQPQLPRPPGGYSDAKSVAYAVRNATGGVAGGRKFDGYRGGKFGRFTIQGCFVTGMNDDHEGPVDGSDRATQKVAMTVVVWYLEPNWDQGG